MDSHPTTHLIDDASRMRQALSPLRRQLLARLREPASAAQLADEMGLPRQRLGYHLRALEAAGLIVLAETRSRRGFTERLLVASADAFVVDPAILDGPEPSAKIDAQDRFAAGHLVATAAAMVRNVTRMQSAADSEGRRLLTFTVEADIGFARPGEINDFAEALAAAVADLARAYPAQGDRRRYRLVAASHPASVDSVQQQRQ